MFKMLKNRKGSTEIVAIVILLAIAGVLAIMVTTQNSKSVLNLNKKAQTSISIASK